MQYKNENNNTLLYHIFIVVYGRQATIHDSKYGTTCVLFASTYTQIKNMYYSLIVGALLLAHPG